MTLIPCPVCANLPAPGFCANCNNTRLVPVKDWKNYIGLVFMLTIIAIAIIGILWRQ